MRVMMLQVDSGTSAYEQLLGKRHVGIIAHTCKFDFNQITLIALSPFVDMHR